METGTIDHTALSKLAEAEAGASRSVHIMGRPGGWSILVKEGSTERVLATQRGQQVRVFRKFETLVAYLKELGIARFDVDAENWNSGNMSSRLLPDTSEALKQVHAAAAYDKWLNAEVQEAIDDTSPTIPHDDVVRDVRAAIKRVGAKRAQT